MPGWGQPARVRTSDHLAAGAAAPRRPARAALAPQRYAGNERTNEYWVTQDTDGKAPSNTRHTPTHHQTPPEPSPKPLLTYALTPPAPRYPHSRHLPLLPPPLLPVELPTPLSPLSPLSPLNPLNLEVAYVIYISPRTSPAERACPRSRRAQPIHVAPSPRRPSAQLLVLLRLISSTISDTLRPQRHR